MLPGSEYCDIKNTSSRHILAIVETNGYVSSITSASLSVKGVTLAVGFELNPSKQPASKQIVQIGKESKFQFNGASAQMTIAYWSDSRQMWLIICGPRAISHRGKYTVNDTHLQTPSAQLVGEPKPAYA